MKNMKKLLVVTLAVLFTFSITGCGNKTTKSSLTPKRAFVNYFFALLQNFYILNF